MGKEHIVSLYKPIQAGIQHYDLYLQETKLQYACTLTYSGKKTLPSYSISYVTIEAERFL